MNVLKYAWELLHVAAYMLGAFLLFLFLAMTFDIAVDIAGLVSTRNWPVALLTLFAGAACIAIATVAKEKANAS